MTNMANTENAASYLTVNPGELRIITSDIEARPISFVNEGQRQGFEPALARSVCDRLNLEPVWFDMPLKDFYPTLSSGDYDVIWFNQVITQDRRAWADFTRPYGRFDTAVLVRDESEVEHRGDLSGKRVGFLQESVNSQLLELLPADIEPVYFEGRSSVVISMWQALRKGQIDAIVEDALVLISAESQKSGFRVAFELPTQYPFGVGVLPGNRELLDALNNALNMLIVDGTLKRLWAQWIPFRDCPF